MVLNIFINFGARKINILHQIKRIQKMSTVTGNKNLISICHMRSTNNKESNLNQVKEIIALSKKQNASFIFLPECCDYVGENRIESLALSEPLNGQLVTTYKNLAKENKVWLSIGGFHESIPGKDGKTEKIHNSHVIINSEGEIEAVYRKLHLFDVETPEFRFRESEIVKAGDNIIAPINTPIGKVGLQICYDMRFPEVSTLLRYKGAQVLTYPSAFAYSTGLAHWEILLRARAIENQCYVIAPAQIGFHNKKRQSFGHAMVVDPWGKIIAQCDDNDLNVKIAEIDTDKIDKVVKNMPCFDHRRKDVYSLVPLKFELPKDDNQIYAFSNINIPLSVIFYNTEFSYAFTNIRCVVEGHVLVATKRSVKRLKDINTEETTDFFQTVCKVQRMLESYYKTTSSTVTVQDGKHAGQTVEHVHCHIMPRKEGDFEQNDQIYTELNNHDNPENILENRRSIEEMSEEANKYRNLMLNTKF